MKKLLVVLTCLFGLLPLTAQTVDFANIDAIMEDNSLRDASNRYTSVMAFFFPESTTRLGMTLSNKQLNMRTQEREKQAAQALESVQADTNNINPKLLSPAKQMDYDLFAHQLNQTQWELTQNRLTRDPVYYADALDAIYDLYLRTQDNPRQRNNDVLARLTALPQTAQEAKTNLVTIPPYLAQFAMEKAYYAYLSIDEIINGLVADAPDEFAAQTIQQRALTGKQAIKDLFDLFKDQSQQENQADFRLSKETYKQLLEKRYGLNNPLDKISAELEKNFDASQHALADALYPFEKTAEDEAVTVIEDGEEGVTVEEPKEPAKPAKKEKRIYIAPTANQFYAIAQTFTVPETDDLIGLLTREANDLADYLAQGTLIPALNGGISIKPLPPYYAYRMPYLFIGQEGFMDFFLREPSGNALAKQEILAKDFNDPMRKVFIAQNLVPGRYYQAKQMENLSRERRYYPVETLQNGWKAFALDLARESGYLLTDEELLAAAWADYYRAISALVDLRLQTRQYSFADAINFLVNENGFTQEQAEELVRATVQNPGADVSAVLGEKTLQQVYKEYSKKIGKKMSQADVIALLLQAGNVAPDQLAKEVKRLEKEHKK